MTGSGAGRLVAMHAANPSAIALRCRAMRRSPRGVVSDHARGSAARAKVSVGSTTMRQRIPRDAAAATSASRASGETFTAAKSAATERNDSARTPLWRKGISDAARAGATIIPATSESFPVIHPGRSPAPLSRWSLTRSVASAAHHRGRRRAAAGSSVRRCITRRGRAARVPTVFSGRRENGEGRRRDAGTRGVNPDLGRSAQPWGTAGSARKSSTMTWPHASAALSSTSITAVCP